jgi:hypothetical protein
MTQGKERAATLQAYAVKPRTLTYRRLRPPAASPVK